jgi:cytoskeleton protein RodZ
VSGVPLAMQATAPAATSGSATPLTRPAAGGAPSAPASAMLVASADQTGAASQGKALHLQFDDDSWVEVRQSDGKLVSSQIFRSGTEQAIDASAPLEVVIGNAPAVKASYRGKPIDLDPYTHARVAHLSIP